MNEFQVDVALWPQPQGPDKPAITHANTINALRIWGCHNQADDLAKVLLGAPVIGNPLPASEDIYCKCGDHWVDHDHREDSPAGSYCHMCDCCDFANEDGSDDD